MTKIAFITFGCSLNFADSELMMGILNSDGYTIVDSVSDASVIVINSCTVKHLSEKKFFKTISLLKKQGKKIVVAGCVAQAERGYADSILKQYSIIGTKQLNRICEVIKETLAGNVVHLFDYGQNERASISRIRRNSIVGIIPISEGCLGQCSYCKTRFARGALVSYSPYSIISQIKSDIASGCKEIWLTSQDCGAYGKDIGTDIIKLLHSVCAIVGNFKVRLGMINPNFAFEYVDALINIFLSHKDKMFLFIHIPVQSGNDRILTLMKRKYNSADFIEICDRFRRAIPEITIATDVICGFPTETEQEFEDTLNLIKIVVPDVINISRFWPRPGTEAEKLSGRLTGSQTNERSRKMRLVLQQTSFLRNKFWLEKSFDVIIDEFGKNSSFIGRNPAYKPFVLFGKYKLGDVVQVTAKKARIYHLE